MHERILVAADGTPESSGALRIARQVAERDGSEVEVLTVVEPLAPYPVAFNIPVPEPTPDPHLADAMARRVRAQVREAVGRDSGWNIHVRIGQVAPVIARRAREGGFSLILLGIGRHRPLDRLFGGETALRVIQVAHVPVLAVQANASELPRRALVAVDFSDLSLHAARVCPSVLAERPDVHLVHVSRMVDSGDAEAPEWMHTYESGARARLEKLARELSEGAGVRAHVSLLAASLADKPAQVLLDVARSLGAELIAAGSHGLGFFGRVLMGSISTDLLRGASGSVLVTPPEEVGPELDRLPAGETPGRAR